METGRVALIRYTAPGGMRCVGSGLLIDERRVLTAAHVAEGSGHRVECDRGISAVVEVLRSAMPDVDLAVLILSEPFADLARLGCAQVDRSRIERVSGCVAVGFPRWRKDGDRRRSAQVNGWLPTAEGLESMADSGLRAGWLTLVGDRIPGAPDIPVGALSEAAPSPWGGMSGAVVVADNLVVGVVRSHNLAAGGQSLTVTPVTAIDLLPDEIRRRFWDALGVADPYLLPMLPDAAAERLQQAVLSETTAILEKASPSGWFISDVKDPFALEVHRPIEITARHGVKELPMLPPYVRREHDERLAEAVLQAANGNSLIKVLVGGSSSGKTRACWEAIHSLPAGWRLWHPIFPDRPEAFLADLNRVGSCTVVWLNEAQHYLLTADPVVGERVAAGLRDMLRDRDRVPLLVLGTIWPQYWQPLCSSPPQDGPDLHAQARALLTGTGIEVPDSFSGDALVTLQKAARADPRIKEALARAKDYQITQYLTGVPVLLERYRAAPPVAKAIVHAAMDARRLDLGPALPHSFLRAAAPGYLTDFDWVAAAENWFESGLEYTAAPCNGILGILTRIRPRPTRNFSEVTAIVRPGQADGTTSEPRYRLADYLEEFGRERRAGQVPPDAFWNAAAAYAEPKALPAIGAEANHLRLYRQAARLWKRATLTSSRSGSLLVQLLLARSPDAVNEGSGWIAANVCLDDPYATASLLADLRDAGAHNAVTILATRIGREGPVHHIAEPYGLVRVLQELRAADEGQAERTLAARVIDATPLNDPFLVAELLRELQAAGADDLVMSLADNAAENFPLDNLFLVAGLLGELRAIGADQAAHKLLNRNPAETVRLNNPSGVAKLLGELRAAAAHDAVTTLVARVVESIPPEEPSEVAWLLEGLSAAGRLEFDSQHQQVEYTIIYDDPFGIAKLLKELRESGARPTAVAKFAMCIAESAPLDELFSVAVLLGDLREAGALNAVSRLVDRVSRIDSIRDSSGLDQLLTQLREAGAHDAVCKLYYAFETVPFSSSFVATRVLRELRLSGALKEAAALACRIVQTVNLDPSDIFNMFFPDSVAELADEMRAVGAIEAVAYLANRGAQIAPPDIITDLIPRAQEVGPGRTVDFPYGREADGQPSPPWGWADLM